MLQIHDFTEARMASLTTRIQKHGDEDIPAVSLGLVMTVANTMLDQIDPNIRESLFKRIDGQPDLPGVESTTPALRCNTIDRAVLATKYEGWTLEVDDGIDETTPKTFGGCKVDKFVVEPLNGGSCALSFRVGTSDLDAERSGMLAMHVGQSIWIKLRAPEKAADAPAPATTTQPDDDGDDAGSLFAASAASGDVVGSERPLTEAEVFPGAQAPTVPVTTKRRRKLGEGLGTDADQAARQAEVLAADPTMAADAPLAPGGEGWPFPTGANAGVTH